MRNRHKINTKNFCFEEDSVIEGKPNSNWRREKNHLLFSSQLFHVPALMQVFC